MKTILMIDDDQLILDSVSGILRNRGYHVLAVENSKEGYALLKKQKVDLVILDIQLQGETGYEICKKLRLENDNTPVLFLTAYEGVDDLVKAFDCGGNDYIAKPFRLRELIARVEALLRRENGGKAWVLASGNLTLEQEGRILRKNDAICDLTDTESKITLCLMENFPHTVPKSMVEQYVWGIDSEFLSENTLNVHMSRLREKIGKEYIETIRGRGYRWSVKVEKV